MPDELLPTMAGAGGPSPISPVLDKEKGYSTSFDDSSDEEDDKKVSSYSITNVLAGRKDLLDPSKGLAFLTHAAGVQILYSPQVQKLYYGKKKELLKYNPAQLPHQEKLEEWIFDNLKSAIKESYFLIEKGLERYSVIIEKIFANFLAIEGRYIQDFAKEISANPRLFFHSLKTRSFSKLLEATLNEEQINSLQGKINCFLESQKGNLIDFEGIELEILSVVALRANAEICGFFDEESEDMVNKIGGILPKTTKGQVAVSNVKRHEFAKELDDIPHSEITPLVCKKIKEWHAGLPKSPLETTAKSEIKKIILTTKLELLKKALEENKLVDVPNSESLKEILLRTGFVKHDVNSLVEFLLENLEYGEINLITNFEEEIDRSSKDFLKSNLLEGQRANIEDSYIFDLSKIRENFYAEFLSTLRVTNRAAKRKITDKKEFDEDYPYLENTVSVRSWKWPSSSASINDTHNISTSTSVRTDLVGECGAYKTVNDKINKLKKFINDKSAANNVVDSDIAYWFEQIIQGKAIEKLSYSKGGLIEGIDDRLKRNILSDLTKIAYLIFGCEVVRNPAAILSNFMIIDLIKNDKVTWLEALTEQKPEGQSTIPPLLPMCIKGAVNEARKLHIDYGPHLPYSYRYDYGTHTSGAALARREVELFEKWLTFKGLQDEFYEVNASGVRGLKNNKINDLYKLILQEAVTWYGLDADLIKVTATDVAEAIDSGEGDEGDEEGSSTDGDESEGVIEGVEYATPVNQRIHSRLGEGEEGTLSGIESATDESTVIHTGFSNDDVEAAGNEAGAARTAGGNLATLVSNLALTGEMGAHSNDISD